MTVRMSESSKLSSKRTGHFAQFSSVTVWCLGIVLQKTLAEPYSLKALVAFQMVCAACLLWSVVGFQILRKGRTIDIPPTHLPPTHLPPLTLGFLFPRLLWGCLAPGLVIPLTFLAAERLEGIVISFFIGFLPLFVPLLARFFLKEQVPWALYLGGAVALLGTGIEVWTRHRHQEIDGLGIFFIVLGILFASFSQILGRFFNVKHAAWEQMAAVQVTGAAIMSVLIWTFSNEEFILPFKTIQEILVCVYLVVVMTSLNFLLFNLALNRISAAWVSLYGVTAPIIGVLASALILGEKLTGYDLILVVTVVLALGIPHYFTGIRSLKKRTTLKEGL